MKAEEDEVDMVDGGSHGRPWRELEWSSANMLQHLRNVYVQGS